MLAGAEKVHPDLEMGCCCPTDRSNVEPDVDSTLLITRKPEHAKILQRSSEIFETGSLKKANEIGKKLSDIRASRITSTAESKPHPPSSAGKYSTIYNTIAIPTTADNMFLSEEAK